MSKEYREYVDKEYREYLKNAEKDMKMMREEELRRKEEEYKKYIDEEMELQKKERYLAIDHLTEEVTFWAYDRGLLKNEYKYQQLAKVMEELGELSGAMLKDDEAKIKDGLGDVIVTLIILAEQLGTNIECCLNVAYNEIKNRKGKTVNGTFIKESE